MKSVSKRASFAVLVLAIFCLMIRYVLCYWCGYYQKSWTPIGCQELVALFGLILLPALLVIWIFSLFRRQHRLWTTTMLAGLLAFMGLKHILPQPHDLILYGMRDGMLQNYNLDDMRQFAREFDQLPRLPNTLENYKLFYWNNDLKKTGLKEKYPFLAHCESIDETDGKVNVGWGGFENHWWLIVAVNPKKIELEHLEPSARIIRVSNDIFFISDY